MKASANRSTGFSRRSFLASAAAVAALATPPTRAQAVHRRIPIGILGTAHSHFRGKHEVLQRSTDFQWMGLCEEDETIRARGPAGAHWLSQADLLASAEVVVVESAVRDHFRHAKMALVAGRHVHIEKPPAASLAEFVELATLAREKERFLQVGYMWRHNPGLERAITAAKEGWLGSVYLVRATMNTLVSADARKEWAEFPGGAMFEQGSHLIDAVVRLLGRPDKVTPFLKSSRLHNDSLADNTVAVFEYRSALAIITSAPLQPNAGAHRFFEILGTRGTARVQPLEPPRLTLDLADAAGPYSRGQQEVPLPPYQRYVDEFTALAAAIRGTHPLPTPLESEIAVQETLMRACGGAGRQAAP